MPSEADYRNAMFQASQAHGGVSQQSLTADSVKKTEQDIKSNEKLQAIINEADAKKIISKDDPVFMSLIGFFFTQSNTPDGKIRALKLAIATTQRLNKEFTFQKKS